MSAFLHFQKVQMRHMIVPEFIMIQLYHSHLAQSQAQQQVLEAFEIQPILVAVAMEELQDIILLLVLCRDCLVPRVRVVRLACLGRF